MFEYSIVQVGRYMVDRQIGVGGMALTYRCRLSGMGGFEKQVVIKLLHPTHQDDGNFISMFLDEARLMARLSHPNIAQVFEIDNHDGLPYIVMEYVAGPNLAMVLKKLQPMEDRKVHLAAWIMAGVCRALSHAHALTDDNGQELHIIHRDVSLGNILVAPDGCSKLIDFGIAKWKLKTNVTEVGMLKGKVHYLAPEQITNQVDHRVDIYQAGVCLYWLATGQPPFHSEDPMQLWRDRMEGRVTMPTQLWTNFPPELEAIILRSLARDPQERYQTGGEMADALVGFCNTHSRYNANDRAVAAWMRELFTPEEFEQLAGRSPSQRTDGKSGPLRNVPNGEGSSISQQMPQPNQPSMPMEQPPAWKAWWPVLAAALAVVLAIVWSRGTLKNNAPDGATASQVQQDKATANALAYTRGARDSLTSGDIVMARQLIDKAKTAGTAQAEALAQIAATDAAVARSERLDQARRLIRDKKHGDAVTVMLGLVEVDPEDTEAEDVLRQAAEAVREDKERNDDRRRSGKLSVDGTVGARLYIDNVPMGAVPTTRALTLRSGIHVISARKRGYRTYNKEITLRADVNDSLKVSMEPVVPPPPVAPAGAVPPK
jgi:serine/threonine-protein kinase